MTVLWTEYIGTALAAAAGGIGAYLAIRIDIEVMKVRLNHADEQRREIKAEVDDAHERIDRLRKSGMDTR